MRRAGAAFSGPVDLPIPDWARKTAKPQRPGLLASIRRDADEEKDELAPLYRHLLRGLDALYGSPTPYISAWHQAPVHTHRDSVRLMLQITSPRRAADRLKYLAGSEAAMGAFIGDVTPERQAEFIRTGLASADSASPFSTEGDQR